MIRLQIENQVYCANYLIIYSINLYFLLKPVLSARVAKLPSCINIYTLTQNYLLYLHLKLLVYALEIVCVIDTYSDAHTHAHTGVRSTARQAARPFGSYHSCSCNMSPTMAQPNSCLSAYLRLWLFETLPGTDREKCTGQRGEVGHHLSPRDTRTCISYANASLCKWVYVCVLLCGHSAVRFCFVYNKLIIINNTEQQKATLWWALNVNKKIFILVFSQCRFQKSISIII